MLQQNKKSRQFWASYQSHAACREVALGPPVLWILCTNIDKWVDVQRRATEMPRGLDGLMDTEGVTQLTV